jgi:hypothetical protein
MEVYLIFLDSDTGQIPKLAAGEIEPVAPELER